MIELFNTVIFTPLYNALIFLISIVPLADVGIAVILLTVLVKVIMFPLAQKASREQARMRDLAPELESVKEEHKEDKKKQTLEVMALYKKRNIRPFLSLLVVIMQIPIILGLYWVFFRGGLPEIDVDLLYSFVTKPTEVNMQFLGLIDMAGRSALLALLAGTAQFIHSSFVLPEPKPKSDNPTLKEDLARSFHLQMKYVMPIIVVVISYTISAAIALYWATSNIFAIGQELLVRRSIRKEKKNHDEQ